MPEEKISNFRIMEFYNKYDKPVEKSHKCYDLLSDFVQPINIAIYPMESSTGIFIKEAYGDRAVMIDAKCSSGVNANDHFSTIWSYLRHILENAKVVTTLIGIPATHPCQFEYDCYGDSFRHFCLQLRNIVAIADSCVASVMTSTLNFLECGNYHWDANKAIARHQLGSILKDYAIDTELFETSAAANASILFKVYDLELFSGVIL